MKPLRGPGALEKRLRALCCSQAQCMATSWGTRSDNGAIEAVMAHVAGGRVHPVPNKCCPWPAAVRPA